MIRRSDANFDLPGTHLLENSGPFGDNFRSPSWLGESCMRLLLLLLLLTEARFLRLFFQSRGFRISHGHLARYDGSLARFSRVECALSNLSLGIRLRKRWEEGSERERGGREG